MYRKLKKIIRTLINDPIQLVKYYLNGRADIIFYCSIPLDKVWIKTTIDECLKRGLNCAIVIPQNGEVNLDNPRIYKAGLIFLKFSLCKISITPASGVKRQFMPLGAKYNVHMPHSFVSLHMIYPEYAFDGYNAIFTCGPHHDLEVRAINRNRKINIRPIPVGYGKFDVLEIENSKHTYIASSKKLVLIAPSWGVDNILDSVGKDLINELLVKGYRIVIRPHPSFFIYNNKILAELETEFSNKIIIEDSSIVDRSIYQADLLISDYSGIAFEYAFMMERPVLFINVAKKILNPNWNELNIEPIEIKGRELIGKTCNVNLKEISHAVDDLIGQNSYKDKIQKFKMDNVYNYGKCGHSAAEEIEKMLNGI